MKKLLFPLFALLLLISCGEEQKPFNYRGIAFSLPTSQFVDSLIARGFEVDSVASDSGRTVVLANPQEHYRILVAFQGDSLQVVQEHYLASSNDSTRMLWQEIRDNLEKSLDAWPDCPILKDDHRVANFDTQTGIISVILENTYTPTLNVRYTPKSPEK